MKRMVVLFLVLVLACCCVSPAGAEALPVSGESRAQFVIMPANQSLFIQLLGHLFSAYQQPDPALDQLIAEDLEQIGRNGEEDLMLARAVAEHWRKTYLDPDYRLYLYGGGDLAPELEGSGIPQGSAHAFAVLGYELQDGEMTEELIGRCRAAAAAARSYPDSVLIMTGGATGSNNPEGHTEAGLMKQYLTEVCGIDGNRIFTDEEAMSTAQNALYTYEILQREGIGTLTLVTSSYHQRWAQVLYHAVGEICRRDTGSAAVLCAGYCWETEPSNPIYRQDARIALMQLCGILGLPEAALLKKMMPLKTN